MSDGKNVSLEEWLEWAFAFVVAKEGAAHIAADISDDPRFEGCELVIDLKIRKREVDDGSNETDAK